MAVWHCPHLARATATVGRTWEQYLLKMLKLLCQALRTKAVPKPQQVGTHFVIVEKPRTAARLTKGLQGNHAPPHAAARS